MTLSVTPIYTSANIHNSNNDNIDYFEIEYSESISSDGVDYKLSYYYDGSVRCIQISGEGPSQSLIRFDTQTGNLYKDDVLISSAICYDCSMFSKDINSTKSESDWVYLTTNQGVIDLTPLNTYLQLASAAAVAIGYVTAATIVMEVGSYALQQMVDFYTGCYYTGYIYSMVGNPAYFKCVHSLSAGSSTYGPYTNYYNAYAMSIFPEES